MRCSLKVGSLVAILLSLAISVGAAGVRGRPPAWKLETTREINIPGEPVNLGFYGVQFFTNEEGIAAVHTENRGLIYATNDGGIRWDLVLENVFELRKFFFLDRNIGWAGSSFGQILFTEDGGRSWAELTREIEGVNLITGIYFTSQDQGYAVANDDSLYSTTDGGLTWEATDVAHEPGRPMINGIFASGDSNIWLVGINLILQSGDGGETWVDRGTAIEGVVNSKIFTNIIFDETGNEGWILGNKGTILHTSDAGETWQAEVLEGEPELLFIDLTNRKLYGDRDRVLYIYRL